MRTERTIVALTLSLTVALAAIVAIPIGTAAARPDQPVITRDVFVHYPRGFDARPTNPAKPGGSGSSCPNATTCPDYKLTRLAWPLADASAGIHYVVDAAGSGLTGTEVAGSVESSFATWATASTTDGDTRSIRFVSDGPVTIADPNTYDGLNSIAFRDINADYPNAIAVTFAWHYTGSRAIIGADTVFNTGAGFSWSAAASATDYILPNIATHEFGHWLQLGDLYNGQDSELTMYGYGSKGETKKETLGYGDILGVQKIY